MRPGSSWYRLAFSIFPYKLLFILSLLRITSHSWRSYSPGLPVGPSSAMLGWARTAKRYKTNPAANEFKTKRHRAIFCHLCHILVFSGRRKRFFPRQYPAHRAAPQLSPERPCWFSLLYPRELGLSSSFTLPLNRAFN